MGSKRNMVLIGFVLSFISIAFNSVVISRVNTRLKAVDDERAKLTESLDRQSATASEADARWAIYRLMHNLSFAMPRAEMAGSVQGDAVEQLANALLKYYQSANDIPLSEITKAEVDDATATLPIMEKGLELGRAIESARNPDERNRLIKEAENLQQQLPEPKSDLIRKIRELRKAAEDAERSGSQGEAALFSSLLTVMKSFQTQMVESTEKKRSRIRELEDERASLVTRANYASYGAIAFQLLGLMFILAKDLLSNKNAS